jgi:hypothetical protein
VPDETPAGDPAADQPEQPVENGADAAIDDATTEGRVREWAAVGDPPPERGLIIKPLVLAAAIVLPAIIVGVLVWFIAMATGPENKARLSADVANVLNAFSQGSSSGSIASRYEGETPPLYPSSVPAYPGAGVVSSVMQVTGNDASYLVIYDTKDSRQKVADYFAKMLSAGPWQVDAAQEGRDSTVRQFTKTDDANLRGLVLAAESKQDDRTTIVVSVQVTSGAKNLQKTSFDPGASRPMPDGFPTAVPQYPGSTVIESSFQSQPPSTAFTVSLLTKDDAAKVLDYYRTQLNGGGLKVDGGDASQGTPQSDTSVTFSDDKQTVGGQVSAAKFPQDDSYTRVDLKVTTKVP